MTKRYELIYEDHDFTPANPGWRIAYLTPASPEPFLLAALSGWMTQIETRYDVRTLEDADDRPRSERPRRVVPVDIDAAGGYFEVCSDTANFWLLLNPLWPDPTEAEAVKESERRERLRVTA